MNFGLQVPAWRGVVASTRATWAWPRRACRASDGTLSIRIRTIDRRSTSSPRCKTPRTFAATPAAKSRSPGATPPTRSLDGSTATYPNAAVAMSKCLSYPWRRLSRRRSSSFSPASASSPYWSSSSSSSSVSGPSSTSRAIIYRHRRQVQVQVQVQVLASLSAIYRSTWKLIFKYKSTFKSCPTFEFVLVFFFLFYRNSRLKLICTSCVKTRPITVWHRNWIPAWKNSNIRGMISFTSKTWVTALSAEFFRQVLIYQIN